MGRIDPRSLPDWFRGHGKSLIDTDLSSPIGTRKKIRHVDATLISVLDGCVVYGREVKLGCIQGCPLDLPDEIETVIGVKRLIGWLVYTNRTQYQNYTVVVADLPASQNLYFMGRLNPSLHQKKSFIVSRLKATLEKNLLGDPVKALSEVLSLLPFQPFETRPDWISAWLIEPQRVETLLVTQRARGRGLMPEEVTAYTPRTSFDEKTAQWSFGICEDVDRCIQFLQIDPTVQTLLEQTEDGSLFNGYPDARLRASESVGPVFRFVRAIAADLKHDVLKAAIMVSLAGVDEELYPNASDGSPRPVVQQVRIYYHRLMYDLVRRCRLSAPVMKARGSGPEPSLPDKSLPERIEVVRDSLLQYGKERVLVTLERQAATSAGPDEDLAMLIVAIPREWPLSEPLLDWLRKNRGHQWQERAIGVMIATLLS